ENYMDENARIYVGQKLKIPGDASKLSANNTYAATQPSASSAPKAATMSAKSSPAPSTHTVASGETLSTIAREYGTTVSSLRKWNSLGSSSRIHTGQILKLKGDAEFVIHQIRPGESLSSIAKKYSTTVDKIISSNKIANPNQLTAGQ